MYYRLKKDHILRGWERMAWVLVKRPQNLVRPLEKAEFDMLLLCDGETELSPGELPGELKTAFDKLLSEGVIGTSEEPGPLEADQYYHYYKNRYVNSIFWSITGRCNFRCRHCFMDAPEGELGELSTKQALSLIDEMAGCGVLRVDITGGEPLVRRDFWQLVDRIISHRMTIGKIYTNGWLLNDELLSEFEHRGLKPDISISFDGIGTHDWMRGVPGAERAALRALKLCARRGYRTDVEMCIFKSNMDRLPETVEELKEAGVSELKVSNVAMTELWACHSEGQALTDEEYIEAMLRYIPKYYEAQRPMDIMLCNVIILSRHKPYSIIAERFDGTGSCLDCHLCGAVRFASYITPEGRLLPCMPMTSSPSQESFPLVQDIGLRKGLSYGYYMQFVDSRVRDLMKANAECNDCPYVLKCGGGCRASALIAGDHQLMGCDRTQCMLWKGGYVERIRNVAEEAMARYEAGR